LNPPRREQSSRRLGFHPRAHWGNGPSVWNPKCATRLTKGTWARSTNIVGIIHDGKDMVVVIRTRTKGVRE
jgi:hypothetical protein